MKNEGLIVVIDFVKDYEIQQLFPSLKVISLEDVSSISYFRHADIVCLIVDVDNISKANEKQLEDVLINNNLNYIFVSTDYQKYDQFITKGNYIINTMKNLENTIVALYGKRVKQAHSGYLFNYEQRIISTINGDIKVRNTPFLIFSYLVKNKNKICSRDEIIQATTGYKHESDVKSLKFNLSEKRKVDVHINYLRNTVADKRLKTVINEGYIFEDN